MCKGEINALKWSDIENNISYVSRRVNQKSKGKPVVQTPPKNKSSYRDLQAPKQFLDILAQHKKRQMQERTFSDDFRVCDGIKCLSDTGTNANIKFANAAAYTRP